MRKIPKGHSLAFLYPKLVEEWHPTKNGSLMPTAVAFGSHKEVWWIDKKGHEWKTEVKIRTSGHNCPYCSGKRVCIDNCLATKNPELSKEWHPTKNGKLTPYNVTCSSHKEVWWKCKKCGNEWMETIKDRFRCNCCSMCSCLLIKNPKLAKEWHHTKNGKLTPHDITAHSHKKVWWIDKKRHKWLSSANARSSGNGCPYCANQKVCIDNCLATLNPEIAKEWDYKNNDPFTPETVTAGSNKIARWMCNCGCEYSMRIQNRTQGGCGCPSCNGIMLKDGSICDSLPEAYYYLKLKNENIKFDYHVKIGLGTCTCDFYIPRENRFIEVTGYRRKWKYWTIYHKRILKKKAHITNVLKAKFEFVQLKLTPKQIQYVRENSI
jgi:hypothetical protein